jgi:hypothetical protein
MPASNSSSFTRLVRRDGVLLLIGGLPEIPEAELQSGPFFDQSDHGGAVETGPATVERLDHEWLDYAAERERHVDLAILGFDSEMGYLQSSPRQPTSTPLDSCLAQPNRV